MVIMPREDDQDRYCDGFDTVMGILGKGEALVLYDPNTSIIDRLGKKVDNCGLILLEEKVFHKHKLYNYCDIFISSGQNNIKYDMIKETSTIE